MNSGKKIVLELFALFAILFLAAPGIATAQQSISGFTAPRINGFDVEQVGELVPGTELKFTLYGTPGSIATIKIPGTAGRLLLEEVETGLYEGAYTIKTVDRISDESRVTANLRLGNRVASVVMDEPMVAAAPKSLARRMADGAAAGAEPRIYRFDVEPNQLVSGSDLLFTLQGTHGGKANMRIAGVRGRINLEETRHGVYEGIYTIRTRDRIAPDSRVIARLRLGDRDTRAILGQSLLATDTHPRGRRAARTCANCGVVEAVNVIEVKGEGTYLGMIAGGLAGVLLGSQVGQGSGKTAAQVAGAAGGAYAGNEIEKRMKGTRHYEVIVRLEGGGTQAASYDAAPGFTVGDKVRVENGTLVRNQP